MMLSKTARDVIAYGSLPVSVIIGTTGAILFANSILLENTTLQFLAAAALGFAITIAAGTHYILSHTNNNDDVHPLVEHEVEDDD